MSYKTNIGDTRETPATGIIEQLIVLGADVIAVDPHVTHTSAFAGAPLVTEADDDTLRTADLVVLLTDHDALDYGRVVALAPRILDTRGRLPIDAAHVERL